MRARTRRLLPIVHGYGQPGYWRQCWRCNLGCEACSSVVARNRSTRSSGSTLPKVFAFCRKHDCRCRGNTLRRRCTGDYTCFIAPASKFIAAYQKKNAPTFQLLFLYFLFHPPSTTLSRIRTIDPVFFLSFFPSFLFFFLFF